MDVKERNKRAISLVVKYKNDGDQVAASNLINLCLPKLKAKARQAAKEAASNGVPIEAEEFEGAMTVRLVKMINSYDVSRSSEFFCRLEVILNNAIADMYNKGEFTYRKNVQFETGYSSEEEQYYPNPYDDGTSIVGISSSDVQDLDKLGDTYRFEDDVIDKIMDEKRSELVEYVIDKSDEKTRPIVAVAGYHVVAERKIDESKRNSGTHAAYRSTPLTSYEWDVNENGIKNTLNMACSKTVERRLRKVREMLRTKYRNDIEKRFGTINDYLPDLGYVGVNA